MPKSYSIAEAKNHLPLMVRRAESGEPVEITRRGEPVAVVLSIEEYRRLQERQPNLYDTIMEFRQEYAAELDDADGDFVPARTDYGRKLNPWD